MKVKVSQDRGRVIIGGRTPAHTQSKDHVHCPSGEAGDQPLRTNTLQKREKILHLNSTVALRQLNAESSLWSWYLGPGLHHRAPVSLSQRVPGCGGGALGRADQTITPCPPGFTWAPSSTAFCVCFQSYLHTPSEIESCPLSLPLLPPERGLPMLCGFLRPPSHLQ